VPVAVDIWCTPPETLVALIIRLVLDVALALEAPVESGIRIVEEPRDEERKVEFVPVAEWSLIGSADEVMAPEAMASVFETDDVAEDKHLEGRAPVKKVDTAVGPADSFAKSRSTTALA